MDSAATTPDERVTFQDPRPSLAELRAKMDDAERRRIVGALEQSAGNQTRAAKLLGMSRGTLVARLDAHGLPRPRKR